MVTAVAHLVKYIGVDLYSLRAKREIFKIEPLLYYYVLHVVALSQPTQPASSCEYVHFVPAAQP